MCRPRLCTEEIIETLGQASQQFFIIALPTIALFLSAWLFSASPHGKPVLSSSLFRHIGRASLKISCIIINLWHNSLAKQRLAPSMFYITLVMSVIMHSLTVQGKTELHIQFRSVKMAFENLNVSMYSQWNYRFCYTHSVLLRPFPDCLDNHMRYAVW